MAFGPRRGGWDWEVNIEVAGKEYSRGAAQRGEQLGGNSGDSQGGSRGFDSEHLAVIAVGVRSESAVGCFGGQVLQEPRPLAGRAATHISILYLSLISWRSCRSSKLGE